VAEACGKFEEAALRSQTPGVRLNLADCYKKLGKPARAWATARDALDKANMVGDTDAAEAAHDLIAALEPSVAFLTLAVAGESGVVGLEVALDGETIPDSQWGTELAVDPGEHLIVANAPGHTSWSTRVTVATAADRVSVPVPVLAAEEPVGAQDRGIAQAGGSPAVPTPKAAESSRRKTRQLVSYSLLGAGAAGLVVGSVLGLVSKATYDHALSSECGRAVAFEPASTCNQNGYNDVQSANGQATASTVAFIAGAALLSGGAYLYFTARKAGDVSIGPTVGSGSAGVAVQGRW
jgi:hypothetical protein